MAHPTPSADARPVADGATPGEVQFDPEAARRILDQAGWVDCEGDGVRDRANPPSPLGLGTPVAPPEED